MRRTTTNEDADFIKAMISQTLLEEAADYIADNFEPDDVFPEQKLRDWAVDNGFVEKED
jgi:hypothetical protein